MTEPKPEQSLEQLNWELEKRFAERSHDQADKLQLALVKAAIADASGVVRNLVLINGAAAISIMTFIGTSRPMAYAQFSAI
jgi:hypothetical protein